jgi:uncharacterized protein (DUF362 family)
MLDASLAGLSGIEEPLAVWRAYFQPGDRVAVKVNAILSGSTHVALAMAVAQRLQEIGIPAANIVLYDRTSEELEQAGFPLRRGGDGVRCYGSDGDFSDGGWSIEGTPVRLSSILDGCDALINMPVLKGLTFGGMSFALKNHYGSVENPSRLHGERFRGGVTGLNNLPPIQVKTRLVIADVLARETHSDWTDYVVLGGVNSLLVSADPLAVDALGLEMAVEGLAAKGLTTRAVEAQVAGWLQTGAEIGLGQSERSRIEVVEVTL